MINCTQCQSSFEATDEDRKFYEKVSPVINGKKYLIPEPNLCHDCRLQRRMLFANEHVLYRRNSSLSGESIVSIYSSDKPDVVYSYDEWWGDSWDATDYGRDFDFSRTFFEQFQELFLQVPKINLMQDGTSENCEYTNYGAQSKNCYLSSCFKCENVYYSTGLLSRDCSDCLFMNNCEKLYECIDCDNCYNSAYLQNSQGCYDSYFLESCTGCKNCLGCKNLKNKKYHIFNKPYSKKEYERRLKDYKLDTYTGIQEFKKQFEAFKLTLPFRFAQQKMAEDSTGDFLDSAKNCHHCFKVINGAENCRYCLTPIGPNCHDVIDSSNITGSLHCESDSVLNSEHILFSHFIRFCSEVFYSTFCYHSEYLFGCSGIRHKKYCIFNKQYSKEKYEELVPKIIEHMQQTGEWGQRFPPWLSSFGYNESYAYAYAPLIKKEALHLGYKWSDYEQKVDCSKSVQANRLPEKIEDVPDDVLNWAIICEVTNRPFKIIKQELQFYRDNHLSLPRRHPDQRILDRYALKNPYSLWGRKCDQCGIHIETSFAPDRPETVYCENCYLKTIY